MSLSDYQKLYDRCEELKAELAEYRALEMEQSGNQRVSALRARFGIRPCCAHILLRLLKSPGQYVALSRLNRSVPVPDNADPEDRDLGAIRVMVKYLRRAMGQDAIETSYGYGYRLSERGLGEVRAALEQP